MAPGGSPWYSCVAKTARVDPGTPNAPLSDLPRSEVYGRRWRRAEHVSRGTGFAAASAADAIIIRSPSLEVPSDEILAILAPLDPGSPHSAALAIWTPRLRFHSGKAARLKGGRIPMPQLAAGPWAQRPRRRRLQNPLAS